MADEGTLDDVVTVLDVPTDAIPMHAVVAVAYLDPEDGCTCFAVKDYGDASYLETIGLVEMAKAALLNRHHEETE